MARKGKPPAGVQIASKTEPELPEMDLLTAYKSVAVSALTIIEELSKVDGWPCVRPRVEEITQQDNLGWEVLVSTLDEPVGKIPFEVLTGVRPPTRRYRKVLLGKNFEFRGLKAER